MPNLRFTGVAYESIKPGSNGLADVTPIPITLWPATRPGESNSDTAKVPSQVAYKRGNNTAWGKQASLEKEQISWVKLLLLDDGGRQGHLANSTHLEEARKQMQKSGKTVVTVIAEYLAKVWEHALNEISKACSRQYLNRRIHVVVTVPAIWEDYAIQRMESAVRMAGILDKRQSPGIPDTTHAFVSEPEAAALAAIQGFKKNTTLKPGHTFVIADLGGGTVVSITLQSLIFELPLLTVCYSQDLISFKLHSLLPKLSVEEVVEGQGGLCGATFLDQAFLACLKRKLSQKKRKEKTLKSWDQMHVLERQRIMDIVWEKDIKRSYYAGQPGQTIDLGAQGNRRPSILLEA